LFIFGIVLLDPCPVVPSYCWIIVVLLSSCCRVVLISHDTVLNCLVALVPGDCDPVACWLWWPC